MKAKTIGETFNENRVFSTKNKERKYPDLTQEEGSLGQRLEKLIKTADIYETLDDLKNAFREIINAKDTHISDRKKAGYEKDIRRQYSIDGMRRFITNVYLKSANLGLT